MRIVALTGIPVDTMRLNLLFRLYTEVFIVHDTRPTDGEGACFRVMLPAIDAPDEDVMVG